MRDGEQRSGGEQAAPEAAGRIPLVAYAVPALTLVGTALLLAGSLLAADGLEGEDFGALAANWVPVLIALVGVMGAWRGSLGLVFVATAVLLVTALARLDDPWLWLGGLSFAASLLVGRRLTRPA